jgi:hypothetical protein
MTLQIYYNVSNDPLAGKPPMTSIPPIRTSVKYSFFLLLSNPELEKHWQIETGISREIFPKKLSSLVTFLS